MIICYVDIGALNTVGIWSRVWCVSAVDNGSDQFLLPFHLNLSRVWADKFLIGKLLCKVTMSQAALSFLFDLLSVEVTAVD